MTRMKMNNFIPVYEPLLDKTEEEYVLECVRSGWISSEGKYIQEFERSWADYCNMNNGIAVSSGTTALQIAVKCLPLNKGDEIIIPSFTIISCAIAVIEAGAIPVLVDCDPETWTMRVDEIEKKISSKTRAIMAVHIYGHPAEMEQIWEIAKKHGLYIIEDAAEAHGAEYKGQKCGGFGDISTFSFYANKIVTTGEGGMILTKNSKFADRARSLRNLCFRTDKRFYHTEMGYNYRMSSIQASIGLAQLKKIEGVVKKRRQIAHYYNKNLKNVKALQLPIEKEWAKNVYWMYAVVLSEEVQMEASQLSFRLKEKNIETRPFFLGMHEQPVFINMGLFNGETYPITERISKKGLYLPSGLSLTNPLQERVCSAIKESLLN